LEAWICKLRAGLSPDNGADFIRDGLLRVHAETSPPWQVPARSTINRVLDRHDLLERNPAKRPRSSWRRFCYARPRDCYQIDATVVALAGGGTAVAFDVIDDCSRKLVACHAAHSETTQAAVAAITKAVNEHGAPGLVLRTTASPSPTDSPTPAGDLRPSPAPSMAGEPGSSTPAPTTRRPAARSNVTTRPSRSG
jgi:transposase InsO family protein